MPTAISLKSSSSSRALWFWICFYMKQWPMSSERDSFAKGIFSTFAKGFLLHKLLLKVNYSPLRVKKSRSHDMGQCWLSIFNFPFVKDKQVWRPSLPAKSAGKVCVPSLPAKSAGQVCRPSLPAKPAGQVCRPSLPAKSASQVCRPSLPAKSAGQGCRPSQPARLITSSSVK
jgi:hypothetical protein